MSTEEFREMAETGSDFLADPEFASLTDLREHQESPHSSGAPLLDMAQSQKEDSLAPVLEVLNRIDHQMTEHESLSEQRARIIDRLHEENQHLKQGEMAQALAPIYRDLMRLYDDLSKSVRAHSTEDASENVAGGKDIVCEWQFYADTVLDILYRYGVNSIDIEPGVTFDGKRHRAIETEVTDDPKQDRCILNVVKRGFQTETRLVRPADVCVLRYVAPLETPMIQETVPTQGSALVPKDEKENSND